MELLTLRCLAEGFDQYAGMGDDDKLTLLGSGDDEAGEGRQKVGVEAGLGFVQHHELRGAWCEKGGGPEEKA